MSAPERIAIIGTGIAGMACGYFLHKRYDLTFYEKNFYIGGHTNTVCVDEDGTEIPIDTGFMVYNEITYPNLTRLFRELEVSTKPTSMSFSVQHVPSGLEFCGNSIRGLFSQRRNFLRPSFLRLLHQISRFNKESVQVLDDDSYASCTLQEYVQTKQYGSDFLDKYLIPMSSAVWSTPRDQMLEFPASTLVRFFHNHGFLGLNTQHPWRTIAGGSRNYRQKLIAPFQTRIRMNRGATGAFRNEKGVTVADSTGAKESFDKIIFACHADQALQILGDPNEQETRLLHAFQYQKNLATVHTDSSVMPRSQRAWSSWNYRMEQNGHPELSASTIYYMNSLQQVSDKRHYFVSVNDPGKVRDEAVIRQIEYEHPVFSIKAIKAQKELQRLNDNGKTYFCGSYFKYGFHEDGLNSAIEVCKRLKGDAWA